MFVFRYTSRASAVCLIHIVYNRVKEDRRQAFKELFIKLCNDDTPVVRKLGAQNFGAFCSEIIKVDNRISQEFIRVFTNLSSDDQVYLRDMISVYMIMRLL